MPRPKPTTTLNTPEPGILSKSGLDVTLENISSELQSINKKLADAPTIAHIEAQGREIGNLKTEVEQLAKKYDGEFEKMDKKYADKKSFELVQKLVFGAVAVILVGVVGGVLSLVIR